MADRRYLYGYTSPPARLTVAELDLRATWRELDSEFKRRLIAMFNACQDVGHDVGIGGGWRSSTQQEQLFRSRYHFVACPGGIAWDGHCWALNAGSAPAAPPGRSYHETTPPNNGAIAADLIGDIAYADSVAAVFGLRSLGDLPRPYTELWHHQPLEFPAARRNYDGTPLAVWPLPGGPAPIPPPGDAVSYTLEYLKNTPNFTGFSVGDTIGHQANGLVPAVATSAGVPTIVAAEWVQGRNMNNGRPVEERDVLLALIQSKPTVTPYPPVVAIDAELRDAWIAQALTGAAANPRP